MSHEKVVKILDYAARAKLLGLPMTGDLTINDGNFTFNDGITG